MPFGRPTFRCEQLETRETPAAGATATFDAAAAGYAPAGWQEWASNNQDYYAVSPSAAVSGRQSLAIYGNAGVTSRLWQPTSVAGNVIVSAAVRGDTPAPILLFARGQSLETSAAGYVAVGIGSGGTIDVRESVTGVERVIANVVPKSPVGATWLRVAADVSDGTVTVRVQRLDTNQFLNAVGAWQIAQTSALTQTTTVNASTGLVGIGRASGAYGTAYLDDFVAAPQATTPPASPQRYSHIRIAQLSYGGTPLGETEKALFANSTDLVITNPQYLPALESASASTPKLIYSNVSNIYQDLLTDWLSTADMTGTSREAAFYHVSQATPFSGSSPSSQPVTWFWNAVRYSNATGASTDVTTAARGGGKVGLTLGDRGDTVAVGSPDRFREVNVTLATAAKDSWTGVWDYVSAVDANGVATAWKMLPAQSNAAKTPSGLRQLQFDPPADWKASRVNAAGDSLYYVRLRATCSTGADAPVIRSILGRDYVNANGGTTGTIPAFDTTADKNRDGYLSDAEYANRRKGFDARFQSESRLFYPYYGQMRYVTNPTASAVKQWAAAFHADILAANPLADGLFLDNENGRVPFSGTPVREATANYAADAAGLVAAIKAKIGAKQLLANTSGGVITAETAGIAAAAGSSFEEFLLRPTEASWATVNDVARVVAARLAASPTSTLIVDSHPGRTSTTDPRTEIGTLAYYYLVADAQRTAVMFFGGYAPAAAWNTKWVPAAAVDVGPPKGAMTIFATGSDPANPGLQYKIYARDYGNALVLYKPRSYTLGKGTGTTADNTATTQALNGAYRLLNADGSVGPAVKSVTLRNGEGAVLIKA